MAKSSISERLSQRVKTIKLMAIQLNKIEFSEQIMEFSNSDQECFLAIFEWMTHLALAVIRNRHGWKQGRHSEP